MAKLNSLMACLKVFLSMVTDSAGMLELTNSSILSGCMIMLGEFIWYLALRCNFPNSVLDTLSIVVILVTKLCVQTEALTFAV